MQNNNKNDHKENEGQANNHENNNGHNHDNGNNDNKKDKDVCLIIVTTQGDWKTTFPKTAKVSEVITAIKQHFGFADNGNYELRLKSNPKEPLKPERTLVSYGFTEDCQEVIFTDLGNAA